MTETASPDTAHANSSTLNGDVPNHDAQPSSQHQEAVDMEDSELSELDISDIDEFQAPDLEHAQALSSKTNGHARELENSPEEPPAKRRRVRDTTPPSSTTPRPKPISPPWKKIVAEGPTSFTENGRRKSGRINTIPLELHSGDKRVTRRALHGQQTSPQRTRQAPPVRPGQPQSSPTAARRLSGSTKPAPAALKAPAKGPRKSLTSEPKPSPRTRRRSTSPKPRPSLSKPSVTGTRRSTRHGREPTEDDGSSPGSVRIKLRVRPPLTTLPLVHRDQANIRPKLGPSFEEWFAQAGSLAVEQGGLLATEDGPQYTDEMARSDARVIIRIEDEAEPGGLLAGNKCSVFEPEAEDEPPKQWAYRDHLVKAASNFRRLMLQEQQRHRAIAKRIAAACEAEWKRRNPQPKTAEEIEQEERERTRVRWRQVARAVAGTWENVKAEVNRRRLIEWEAEEHRRVKAALNQAVNLSEQKLQARQARFDTDELSDVVEDGDVDLLSDEDMGEADESEADMMSGGESGADESNMSTSEDDEDKNSVLSDEGLTQEQLREKYANLPELNPSADEDNATLLANSASIETQTYPEGAADDTSDESIDMDDDLGSTEDEMDSDSDGGNSEGDTEESDGDGPSGLLGLFFKKSELKKLKDESATPTPYDEAENTDDGELSKRESPAPKPHEHLDSEVVVDDEAKPIPEIQKKTTDLTNGVMNGEMFTPKESTAAQSETPLTNGHSSHTEHVPASTSEVKAVAKMARFELSDLEKPDAGDRQGGEEPAIQTIETEDITMADAEPKGGFNNPMDQTGSAIPTLDVPASELEGPSPVTDPVTNLPSASRSQSPRTSDTKPTDLDTASSVEPLAVSKAGSGLATPVTDVPKTEIPFLLRGTLREYQHRGLDWLAGLYANSTNGILADEMGLGKTIQTIALLSHLACYHGVWGPHLVIVPTSVMLNWEMEFKKWCPGFKILTYYGNQEERKRKRQGWTNDDIWNVCITSYQMVLQDQQVFRRRRWHYMILDEAHNIKNFKSKRWQTLLGFNTHSRLLLTGTPLQNNLTELWSLLYFLTPPENGQGGFVDQAEFNNWFSRPENQILENGREQLDDEARAIISKLHKVLRPYLLRRLKADVEKQMPAKYEHVEFCRLSKRQRELYDGFLSQSETRKTLSSGNYMSIINCLMQLRKVCNHPDLFVDRPIMTSFSMKTSVPAIFEDTEQQIRRTLLFQQPMSRVSLSFLNMIPTQYESRSSAVTDRIAQLSSQRAMLDLREAQKARANSAYASLDPDSVKSNITYLESAARWGRFEELQHCVYLNALRRQQRPIYGKNLVKMLTLDTGRRPFKQRPKVPREIMRWFEEDSFLLHNAIPTLEQRAASMDMTVSKFAFATPPVVAPDMNRVLLGSSGIETFDNLNMKLAAPVKYAPYMPPEAPLDPWHEARIRLSIQFPDKRLLQYDCGKLQALDKLLRKLQAGGHRALIFTQMTKVLDVLEQFLNIHGHKYLRLDGTTKVEQRQILTDRFNHDPRILCFILSTRSGGLGINLTGADTVIFYDQDWNPAMDKQCQDRSHRIGQTRDVHIYRLVSEHTIEANILRKASQKQMLDDVVIQEGEFTTDYFNKLSVRDVIGNNGEVFANTDDLAANAAVDRVLGGADIDQRHVGRVLEQAEDQEDVAAARRAEKENRQDDADFLDQRPTPGEGSGISSARTGTPREGTEPLAPTPGPTGPSGLGLFSESVLDSEVVEHETNAFGEPIHNVDDFMLAFMSVALENTPLELPKDRKKSKKKGKDTRKR